MRLQFLLTLLLYVGLSKVKPTNISNDDHELKIGLQQEAKCKNSVNKITFDDLYEDVLFLIFYELNFFSLLHVAEMNSKCASIANGVFRVKYRDFEIRLWRADIHDDEKMRIDTKDKAIGIYDYELGVGALRYIGNSIQRIWIDYSRMESNHSTVLNRLIIASESITHFHINFIKEDTFSQFTAPFQAVEHFSCYIYTGNFTGHILPLDQLFPRLRTLKLTLFSNVDYSFFDRKLPNLEEFDFNVGNSPITRRMELIESVLRKNPQIQSIQARFSPAKLIKEVNYLLPSLSNLTLHDFRHNLNETIHFENVKYFNSYSLYIESIDKLTFSKRLASVEMVYNTEKFNLWRDFFRNHRMVKKLHMKFICSVDDEQLVAILLELWDLRELILESYGPFNDDVIKDIIQRHEKLVRFEFSSLGRYYHIEDIADICQRFGNEWSIQKLALKNGFSFERKDFGGRERKSGIEST